MSESATPTCRITDCAEDPATRGYCTAHYRKGIRNGTIKTRGRNVEKEPCAAEDCDRARVGQQDYCNLHYQRVLRNGDLEVRASGPKAQEGTTRLACARCRRTFKASKRQRDAAAAGRAVYCTRECQKGDSSVTLPCNTCGADVVRRSSEVPKSGRVFCDADCRGQSQGGGGRPRTGHTIACETCGTDVWVKPSETATKRFCSAACNAKAQERRETRICPQCEETFEARLSDGSVYCSSACHGASRRAKPGNRYVNPKTGYAWLYIERDGEVVKVQEHRHVMSQILGRPLESWEEVHHQTGGVVGRSNNSPSNLELWVTRHADRDTSGHQPSGHRPEDIVRYCREMLAVYGTTDERTTYASHSPLTGAIH